jgi:hypothetical protein
MIPALPFCPEDTGNPPPTVGCDKHRWAASVDGPGLLSGVLAMTDLNAMPLPGLYRVMRFQPHR